MKKNLKSKKVTKKKKVKKMPQYQIDGIKIFDMLTKISKPSGIKDVVKWMR